MRRIILILITFVGANLQLFSQTVITLDTTIEYPDRSLEYGFQRMNLPNVNFSTLRSQDLLNTLKIVKKP